MINYAKTIKIIKHLVEKNITDDILEIFKYSSIENHSCISEKDISNLKTEKEFLKRLIDINFPQIFTDLHFNNKDLALKSLNKIILDVSYHSRIPELKDIKGNKEIKNFLINKINLYI